MNYYVCVYQVLLLGVLATDMIERRFPNEFNNFIIECSLNVIHFYSKIQILFTNLHNKLSNMIDSDPRFLHIKNFFEKINNIISINVEIIRDGEIVHKCWTDDLKNMTKYPKDYDFIIYSDYNNKSKSNNCINKVIIYNQDKIEHEYQKSDISFILTQLCFGDNQSCKLDLKTDSYNFYVSGNRFTKSFFIYYLKEISKINVEFKDTDKFTLNIIDHDVNKLDVDFTDKKEYILIDKNGYNLSIINHSK